MRPSLPPSVVSLPGRISQQSESIVYPYSQQSPESKRPASHYPSTMRHAASLWPTQSKPFDYSRQPPSSVVPSLERIHPLKKVDQARQSLSLDTSYVEGDEFTALIQGMQEETYGAVDSGNRRISDMSSKSAKKSLVGESKRPPKRPMTAVPTTPDVSPRRSHRRHNSDNSRTATLPVRARSLTNYEGSPSRPLPRTLSSSSLNNNVPASRHHRRRSSNSVFSSVGSVMTDASMMTLVTDIEKSSLFAGYDEFTGQALFNLPISSVQISVEEHPNGDEFYQIRENDQTFENYHRQGEDYVVTQINAGSGPRYALPPTRYVIHAPPDLYRRMVDEISSSASLPCGLFFCGHHEDVAKPSLRIAVLVLLIFFGWMGLVAYIYRG